MSRDSDLYGEDIQLWAEQQGALLRRVAAGEAVTDQVDWSHVFEEIEHGHGQRDDQDEIVHLRARLSAAEALIKELRARLDDAASRLTSTQAELTTPQGHAEAATARAVAAVAGRC